MRAMRMTMCTLCNIRIMTGTKPQPHPACLLIITATSADRYHVVFETLGSEHIHNMTTQNIV
jgi:hypothetical protein